METSIALAVNYSPQARELALQKAVDFDLFKCPDWPQVLSDAGRDHRTYIHHDLMAGQGQPGADDIDGIGAALESTQTPFVNTHVAPLAGVHTDAEAMESVRGDVTRLCDAFGPDRVIVENVPWESTPDYPIAAVAADPTFVTEVLNETGALLLLDLAHARVAAAERGQQVRAFIAAHPLYKLRELHVTGLGKDDEGRVRESMPMQAADWELFVWVLDCIAEGKWPRPWAIALEYGGVGPHFEWRTDIDALALQLQRCAALMRERGLRD